MCAVLSTLGPLLPHVDPGFSLFTSSRPAPSGSLLPLELHSAHSAQPSSFFPASLPLLQPTAKCFGTSNGAGEGNTPEGRQRTWQWGNETIISFLHKTPPPAAHAETRGSALWRVLTSSAFRSVTNITFPFHSQSFLESLLRTRPCTRCRGLCSEWHSKACTVCWGCRR